MHYWFHMIAAKLRDEPLRLRVYGIAILVLGYLGSQGHLDSSSVEFYGTLAALVLSVETARAKVSPYDDGRHDPELDGDDELEDGEPEEDA